MSDDKRLKLYIISCHTDKPLKGGAPKSVYDCPIQAGVALTDIRMCALNDHDGFAESISDRNSRYSEGTAMWWIGAHIDTPYVGIVHYRKRLRLSDAELSKYMDQGVDIITTRPMDIGYSIEEEYRDHLYSADWDLFMEIMQEQAPADMAFAQECFASHLIHTCNINILKGALYRTYCEWAFPMLDAFYRRSSEKTDVYQHRDVGFIAERLSHLFVMKMQEEGKRIVEAELIGLQSSDWNPKEACNMEDFSEVFATCDRLYRERQITKCCNVLGEAMRHGGESDEKLRLLSEVLITGIKERRELPLTMHEYLPTEMRANLDILMQVYGGLRKAVHLYLAKENQETREMLEGYLRLTQFSELAIREICGNDRIKPEYEAKLLVFFE